MILENNIKGSIFGTAFGDMIGLPFEGLKRSKAKKVDLNKIGFWGNGLFSDDTEHTVIIAQCLIESNNNPKIFKKLLKRRLQIWLLSMPIGVGFATLKAILKSFIGLGGVFSAGNGPAMRVALIGLVYGDDNTKLQEFVKISTEITHTDKKAYLSSLAIAKASYLSAIYKSPNLSDKFLEELNNIISQDEVEFYDLIKLAIDNQDITTSDFSAKIGMPDAVSGYIYHTLPIVIHSWLRNPNNLNQAIKDVIVCGGDTDTTGAIVGSIVGANGDTLDKNLLKSIKDYPINENFLNKISTQLYEVIKDNKHQKALFINPISKFIRNILFFIFILFFAIIRIF